MRVEFQRRGAFERQLGLGHRLELWLGLDLGLELRGGRLEFRRDGIRREYAELGA
jgi:hypothetical protein